MGIALRCELGSRAAVFTCEVSIANVARSAMVVPLVVVVFAAHEAKRHVIA